ncbi:hypothetical protein N836_36055 [Leptolyngbya sp. Heron Island J]|uniref:DUF6883 domain-containing protein n=1 Tax=Leptolyngbya sp. Heron Island J TaxID=1385935 RepID=UPI0003B9A827|nr:DUF6883 domain-containing protein [Leptolyngbya sp. Heron Island J]ESA37583.1 hypothetical protein N836_36055 [Leptolyngbya sp. Heron Island J]
MRLPNGEQAILGDKLERYCLNFKHHKGKDKAALFRKRLGITLANKLILEAALLNAAATQGAILRCDNEFGQQYNIKFYLETTFGASWVLSCWIIRTGKHCLG